MRMCALAVSTPSVDFFETRAGVEGAARRDVVQPVYMDPAQPSPARSATRATMQLTTERVMAV